VSDSFESKDKILPSSTVSSEIVDTKRDETFAIEVVLSMPFSSAFALLEECPKREDKLFKVVKKPLAPMVGEGTSIVNFVAVLDIFKGNG